MRSLALLAIALSLSACEPSFHDQLNTRYNEGYFKGALEGFHEAIKACPVEMAPQKSNSTGRLSL